MTNRSARISTRAARLLGVPALGMLVAGCSYLGFGAPPESTPPVVSVEGPADVVQAPEPVLAVEPTPPEADAPETPVVAPQPEASGWAERTLAELSLREKVGQLIMPWVLGDFAPEGSESHERIARYVEDQGIGGVIMSVGSPTEVAAKLNDLQRHAKIPLLVAADLETGAGFRMRGAIHMPGNIDLGGATNFPPLMAVGAAGDAFLAYEMGRITAIEARAVGIHVPFAPVLDVNNNPDNPIINVRSFGEDPVEVSRMGVAFIRGIQDNGAIATGKHFPGHGDTETDSHVALPVIRHDRARMDSIELRPFRDAIAAGMGAIMTAHISVPGVNGGDLEPATLSPMVLTEMLRSDLGFDGIIFTDAMDMSAVARRHNAGEAAVLAIEAGADVILMPPNVGQAIDGIVAAVVSGRISEERIDASVLRVLGAKEQVGLDEERFVDLGVIGDKVGIPEHERVADRIAERAITVLKNGSGLLPLRGTRTASVLSITFRRGSDLLAGRAFNEELRRTYPRLVSLDVESGADDEEYARVLRRARGQALVIVSTYSSYAGTVSGRDELSDFIQGLDRLGVPHMVISFGNPYIISGFPETQAYMLAWNGSEASQRAAVGALMGGFDVVGRAPTRIPPGFELGDGLTIPTSIEAAGGG